MQSGVTGPRRAAEPAGAASRLSGELPMTERAEDMIRGCAAGEMTWRTLRERGFDSLLDLSARLGGLDLRQAVAATDGPNVERPGSARAF
jgi:hypothetical protein